LVGATVTDIQPFVFLGRPTCTYEGDITSSREAVITIAGVVVCVAVGLLGLLLIPFKVLRPRTALAVAAFLAPLPGQALAWFVFPALHVFGGEPEHDAIIFAQQSGLSMVLVAAIGLGLTVLGLKVFLQRTQFASKFNAALG
jgi:hypothetical protein